MMQALRLVPPLAHNDVVDELVRVDAMERVAGFIASQRMGGLSPATVKRRNWTLTTFVGLLEPRRLEDATVIDVERFLTERAAPATRRALLADLRAFYRWAGSRGVMTCDPTAPIRSPKVPKRLPTPLTRDELALAWDAAGWELRMIIALGASAGLRVAEIAALEGVDIDCEARVLTVRNGKGGKDRRVPMSHHLVTIFSHVGPGPVFRAATGDAISAKVRAHFRSLGIRKRPHDLRATFCTELARVSGGNMVLVAQLAGHESMATTQRYVSLPVDGWSTVDQLYAA